MKKNLNKGIDNNENINGVKGDNEESELNDANMDNEASTSDDPFFIMTLEFEKGKYKKIKIFPTSDPTELAFNFCKENNLDFSSLKFLSKEISLLLTKYKSKQLDLFQSNNSIQEVEEEHIQTELTKSPEKNEEEKSNRSGQHKFIYSSIDSNRNNDQFQCQNNIIIQDNQNNGSNNNRKMLSENQFTVEEENEEGEEIEKRKEEEIEERKEEEIEGEGDEGNNKFINNDFINYKEEYYPINEDNEDIEYIKLNLKAQEANDGDNDNDHNKKEERKEEEEVLKQNKNAIVTQMNPVNKSELDQENTRALLFNNQPQCKSVQSSFKNEDNKTSKPSNTLQSTDNVNDNNASSRLSYTMKPHPKLTNFQTEEDEIAKLIEIKRKKDEQIRQLQIELENEEKEHQREREEQLFLEEQDRIEREEYIRYEKEQALKQANINNTNTKDTKKKNLTLNEIDYNFIGDTYIQSESKTAQKNNYKQLIIETTQSNKPTIPAPNIDTNQHLFQYEILTDHHNTSQRITPLSYMKNERNSQCTTSSNTHHNPKVDNCSNIISLKKNNFSLLKPEMNLNRCCSANIFEKLYSEAELKRQLPKKPCHFSYRKQNKYDSKGIQTRSMSNSNSQNTHIKISSSDFIIKNNYNKTTSKTPSASNRYKPHPRKSESYNSHNISNTNTQFNHYNSQSNINNPRVRNKIIQKEHNSYSSEINLLQTTNSNLKALSVGVSPSQSKIMKTDYNVSAKIDKESKIRTLKLLTKKNLTNPLLKKKIEQIKKEFQEKYTFKPKINKQIMSDQDGREGKNRQHTDANNKCNGNFTLKDNHNHSKSKRKDCNAFNKNYDIPSKIKTNRNSIFNKSNDYSEPFKWINNTPSMIAIKKEETFLRLFRELDDDEDGVITSVHCSTKTIPDNIIALISPILNLVKHGITSFTAKTFVSSINVIYEKMSTSNKQLLLEHFLQKRKKEQKQSKQQTTNQYKAFIDNQTKKNSNNLDKGISLSFSHNNILTKKPMQYNSMSKINSELRYPHYDSDVIDQ